MIEICSFFPGEKASHTPVGLPQSKEKYKIITTTPTKDTNSYTVGATCNFCKKKNHTEEQYWKKKSSINIVQTPDSTDSSSNPPQVLHFLPHNKVIKDSDEEWDSEIGYHVLGMPGDIPVPINLLPSQPVSESTPNSIFHVCNV